MRRKNPRRKPLKKTRKKKYNGGIPWLSNKQMKKLRPFFPKSRGKPRVDDQRVLSGILYVQQVGCRWQDALPIYGPYKTLYSRWVRWSRNDWFTETMRKLASRSKQLHILMIDATHIKVHRTATSFRANAGELGRFIGKTKGGWNTKLHAICDGEGRIIDIYLTGGNANDFKGAEVLLKNLPKRVKYFLGDKGYDGNWVRNFLKSLGITPCIPGKKSRIKKIRYNKKLYKERNKIERAFCKIKDWRRLAMRYDRCPEMFMSTCAFAVMVKFWL